MTQNYEIELNYMNYINRLIILVLSILVTVRSGPKIGKVLSLEFEGLDLFSQNLVSNVTMY